MSLWPKTEWGKTRAAARRARKYNRNFRGPWDGYDHAATVRLRACANCGSTRTQACHLRARGMGGSKGDWTDLVPLCGPCHRELDVGCWNSSEMFKETHGVDLRALADRLVAQARKENG